MNIPKKRSRTFVRPRLQEVYFPFDIHSSIPRSDVSEAYDPVGDGHCGFRSASFLVHGNEGLYPIIKQEMLKALKKNREVYEKSFGIDVKDAEEKITCGIDLITEEMKAMKTKRTNNSEIDEDDASLNIKHPKSHRQSKVADQIHWGALRMKNGHTSNPAVNRLYFAIDGKKKDFQVYWNKWGQFPKVRN
ncbi:hypothetical protein BD560DRAFT_415739 [Blakeslea trispora]|nr:hypothetical protein BD560DRAFT_415739 [Blakeslea trispora]